MQKDFEYLYSLRKYILAVTGFFVISLLIGVLEAAITPGLAENYFETLRNSFGWIKSLSPLLIMLIIFLNNAFKSLLVIILGVGLGIILSKLLERLGIWNSIILNNFFKNLFAFILFVFALIPIFFVAYNGRILGLMADSVSRQQGILFVTAALLPHGIIEVPMVLISAGIGLKLGAEMVSRFLSGEQSDVTQELKNGMVFYFRRIAPLLFVAAVIETFVTPLIALQFIAK